MSANHPTLGQGTQGPQVSDLQTRLARLGFYKGPVSGHYSPDTAMAVVQIQRLKKLTPVNGGMYEAVWKALEELEAKAAPAPAPPKPAPTKPPPPREPPPMKPAPKSAPAKPQPPREPLPMKPAPKPAPAKPPPPREPPPLKPAPKPAPAKPPPPREPPPMKPAPKPAPPPPEDAVVSGPVLVGVPAAAILSNLRWEPRGDATSRSSGTDLCADAPGLDGTTVELAIDAWTDAGWKELRTVVAMVKDHVARAPLPRDLGLTLGQKMRFRAASRAGSIASPQAKASGAPPPAGHPDKRPFLFQGASGAAVSDLQERLGKLRLYAGTISGRYSPATAMAVVKLQKTCKLSPVNGGMYAACWDALEKLEQRR